MTGLLLPACASVFSILLCLVYFSKKRVNLLENKMYAIMIVSVLCDSLIVSLLHTFPFEGISSLEMKLIPILNKIDYLFYISFSTSLFFYIALITLEKFKKSFNLYILLFIIFDIIIFITLITFNVDLIILDGKYSVKGMAVDLTYIICGLYLISAAVISLLNIRKVDKKHLPLFATIILLILSLISFKINPYLIMFSISLTFVNYIMYFTIENPDVKMIEQLELARRQADKANKAKTEFLSSMSHEIRTPLNAIVGFSECLVEDKSLNDEVKGYAKDIVDASHNLLEIVNGILDISKIEANKMDIIPKDYNPKEVFTSLEKLILPRIIDKPIEFKSYIAEDLPGVLNGDVSKVKQIILNILTNAAKYTDKGEITYSISCINKIDKKKCSLFISVKDTGRGIKKENIDKLFNKFERIDEDKNTTIEGTGLGLAITKRLVEMLGGKINVFSKYGEGSNFTIYLEQDIISMEIPKIETKEITVDYSIFKGKKVLLVDDSTINLKVATQILKPYNFEITTAISGFEAIDKVNNENYDIILMDIMMPKMDGVETLQKLKEKENFITPVIALTADAIEGMDAKYISEGFNDYLSKPINKEELNRVINKYMKGEH